MRILLDHQVFCYQRVGGISRYFCEIASRIAAMPGASCEIPVRYSENEYLTHCMDSCSGLAQLSAFPRAFPIGSLGRFVVSYGLNGMRARSALDEGTGRFDVFHPTFYDDYFLGHLKDQPFVVTIHDMIPERFPGMFNVRGIYGRLVTKRWIANKPAIVRRAAHVIAVSHQTKADLVDLFGTDPSKVSVVHHGGTLDHLIESARVEFSYPYLLYVGTRQGYKNFPCFVRATRSVLQANRELRVKCVGGGGFTKRERCLLGDYCVADRYEQLTATDAELANLYGGACAFVFPSCYEGFGIPIVEAMSCGCPCILADTPCFREIGQTAAEYFPPSDPAALSDLLHAVLSSDSRRADLASRGRVQALRFSWDRAAAETASVYRRAVR